MWKLKEPAPSQKEGGKTDEKEQTIIPPVELSGS